MQNGSERLDRIERILEKAAKSIEEVAVRQQYHDEAFGRHDTEMKSIREAMSSIHQAISIDAENIRALARIAELHDRRLDDLERGT